jgi:DNA modification methylase
MLFGADRTYAPLVLRIRKGDLLFLNNLDTNTLYGVFQAVSDGSVNIQSGAWNGRFPYQVKAAVLGKRVSLENARKTLASLGIKRNTPVRGKKLVELLDLVAPNAALFDADFWLVRENIKKRAGEVDIEAEIPLIEATTLWDFPRQSYGLNLKGNNKYPGVTPALIIYNMVWRYTEPGDLVVDPMCGSGTTIDVCTEEKRRVVGLDISPTRSNIIQGDAREMPIRDSTVDMVFIDSPYGDNVRYNDHRGCIGKISSESSRFYDELEKAMVEAKRILKEGKALGWLIGDQWVKRKFTPVGLRVYERLCKHFEPVDIVCVTRRGQSSNTGSWYNRARRFNFFLRGFKYLIIVKKASEAQADNQEARKINWAHYERSGAGNEH